MLDYIQIEVFDSHLPTQAVFNCKLRSPMSAIELAKYLEATVSVTSIHVVCRQLCAWMLANNICLCMRAHTHTHTHTHTTHTHTHTHVHVNAGMNPSAYNELCVGQKKDAQCLFIHSWISRRQSNPTIGQETYVHIGHEHKSCDRSCPGG